MIELKDLPSMMHSYTTNFSWKQPPSLKNWFPGVGYVSVFFATPFLHFSQSTNSTQVSFPELSILQFFAKFVFFPYCQRHDECWSKSALYETKNGPKTSSNKYLYNLLSAQRLLKELNIPAKRYHTEYSPDVTRILSS